MAASLTCSNGIPNAEELFKWLIYASEGTCLRTRPRDSVVEKSCLQNPREWPAALASSLEARILAVCPVHIACWDVATAEVLQQPDSVPGLKSCEPRRTRRSRKASKKKTPLGERASPAPHAICEHACPVQVNPNPRSKADFYGMVPVHRLV